MSGGGCHFLHASATVPRCELKLDETWPTLEFAQLTASKISKTVLWHESN